MVLSALGNFHFLSALSSVSVVGKHKIINTVKHSLFNFKHLVIQLSIISFLHGVLGFWGFEGFLVAFESVPSGRHAS